MAQATGSTSLGGRPTSAVAGEVVAEAIASGRQGGAAQALMEALGSPTTAGEKVKN